MTRRHLAPLVLTLALATLAAPALGAEAPPRDLAPALRAAVAQAVEAVLARLALVFTVPGDDGGAIDTAGTETAPLPTEPAEMAGEIDPNG